MLSRSCLFVCAFALLAAASGCSRQEESTPCVATPTVTLARDRAAIGSPLKVSYTFAVAQNASIPQDYLVFVHVLDDQGSASGETITRRRRRRRMETGPNGGGHRTVFVPNYPYIGAAHLRIGLYSPSASQRLPLCATDIARREVPSREVPAPAAVGEHLPRI